MRPVLPKDSSSKKLLTMLLSAVASLVPATAARGFVAIIAIAVVAASVATVAVVNTVVCDVNVFFGCGGATNSGGSGGGGSAAPVSCTSAANACGMTNTGTQQSGGSCSAVVPSNSTCPTPTFGTSGSAGGSNNSSNGFYASPSIVAQGSSTTLYWSAQNATSCTVTGGGLSYTGGASGNVSTGNIFNNTTYTITCEDGAGGPTASTQTTVIVAPTFQEI